MTEIDRAHYEAGELLNPPNRDEFIQRQFARFAVAANVFRPAKERIADNDTTPEDEALEMLDTSSRRDDALRMFGTITKMVESIGGVTYEGSGEPPKSEQES